MSPNRLYYGDNLTIMRDMPIRSVDLIYLDPPFNSKKNYNLMYRTLTGRPVPDQADAFCDMWEMDPEKEQVAREMPVLMREHGVEDYYVEFWRLWMQALRYTQPHLLAYLIYMVERILQMKVLLRDTGSIYLHCDPTASHYIKVMMDGVFGHGNFRNEIVWKRTSAHSDAGTMGSVHDTLLFYTKSKRFTFNVQHSPYDQRYIQSHYRRKDGEGRRYRTDNVTAGGLSGGGYEYEWNGIKKTWRYPRERMQELHEAGRLHYTRTGNPEYIRFLDEGKGTAVADLWTDVPPINSQAKERLGYSTQKPMKLLKRVIEASSNPGNVVFDPFCGCGTTIYAADLLGRKWIGIDVAILAVQIVADTLYSQYKLVDGTHYEITGVPVSEEQALDLFKRDPFQFQHWVVEKVGGFPSQRKVADKGIDGRIYFETLDGLKSMVLSVKGGGVRPTDIRDLRGVLGRDEAVMGGFISNKEPTRAMIREAASAGMFRYGDNQYPRLQMITVKEIFEAKELLSPTKVTSRVKTGQSKFKW